MTSRTIGQATANGAAWFLAQNLVSRSIQMAGQVAVAWFLSPEEFGRVGLALTVTNVVGAAFGIGVADVLQQRGKCLDLWAGPAFWLCLGASLLSATAVVAVAPFAQAMYGAPGLSFLICVAALTIPVDALGAIPQVVLRNRMDFRPLAWIATAEVAACQATTLAMAWQGFGALSYLLPSPIYGAVRVALLWRAAEYPKVRFRVRRWRCLVPRSLAILANRLLISSVSQGDYAVLGVFASEAQVGLYYFAFKVANQSLLALGGSLNNVLFPALTRVQGDAKRMEAAMRAALVLNLAVMPMCFLQAALAGPAISMLFPHRWSSSVPIIEVLSVAMAFDGASWACGSLLSARGEFVRSLRISSLCAPVFFVLVGLGAKSGGAMGVSLAILAYYGTMVFAVTSIVMSDPWRMARAIYVTALVAGVAVGCPTLFARSAGLSSLAQLLVVPALSAPIYLGLVRWLYPDAFEAVLSRVAPLLARAMPGRFRKSNTTGTHEAMGHDDLVGRCVGTERLVDVE